jgi:hypothetical protein
MVQTGVSPHSPPGRLQADLACHDPLWRAEELFTCRADVAVQSGRGAMQSANTRNGARE